MTKFAGRINPLEQAECFTLAEYLELIGVKFAHIPNETFTKSWAVKAKNKRMGVSKGVPDYLLVFRPDQSNTGVGKLIFIEMKREKGGRTSPEQKEWLKALNDAVGVKAYVCNGFDEAREVIDSHMKK